LAYWLPNACRIGQLDNKYDPLESINSTWPIPDRAVWQKYRPPVPQGPNCHYSNYSLSVVRVLGQQYPVDDVNHAVVGEDIGPDDQGIW
jgi:hypothetical protein